jgi:hypothetical protein
VIARVLSASAQSSVTADPRRFVRADGRFDIDVLLREFAAFWVEQGESMTEGATYAESGAQLVLMAYLQRVVNGGGTIEREYGLGHVAVCGAQACGGARACRTGSCILRVNACG